MIKLMVDHDAGAAVARVLSQEERYDTALYSRASVIVMSARCLRLREICHGDANI